MSGLVATATVVDFPFWSKTIGTFNVDPLHVPLTMTSLAPRAIDVPALRVSEAAVADEVRVNIVRTAHKLRSAISLFIYTTFL